MFWENLGFEPPISQSPSLISSPCSHISFCTDLFAWECTMTFGNLALGIWSGAHFSFPPPLPPFQPGFIPQTGLIQHNMTGKWFVCVSWQANDLCVCVTYVYIYNACSWTVLHSIFRCPQNFCPFPHLNVHFSCHNKAYFAPCYGIIIFREVTNRLALPCTIFLVVIWLLVLSELLAVSVTYLCALSKVFRKAAFVLL